MNSVKEASKYRKRFPDYCFGASHFAAEHWVHSHPSVMPCDLSTSNYTDSFENIPRNDFEIKLETAPRPELFGSKNHERCPQKAGGWNILKEYEYLYGEPASESWWGFKIYDNMKYD